jgi:N-methylhydantoinase B/oxoprolinase/acetone carboxylase alpha subunit
MFDQEHPMEVDGVVKDFKYTSPHTFIILTIKDKDGTVEDWNLEGGSPSALARDGWNNKSLKPGDELHLSIDPLRSGAPGGAWNVNKIKFKDGSKIGGQTH